MGVASGFKFKFRLIFSPLTYQVNLLYFGIYQLNKLTDHIIQVICL